MTWEGFFSGETPSPLAMFEQALLLECIHSDSRETAVQIAGFGGFTLTSWWYQPDLTDPSWAMYTDQRGRLLLTVAGTQSLEQATQHLTGAVPLAPFPGAQATIADHGEAAARLADAVAEFVPKRTPTIDYSGHSYGASVAQIMWKNAALPEALNLPGDCMTFGSCRSFFGPPPPIKRGSCVRVSNQGIDPVAHIPPKRYNLAPFVGDLAGLILGVEVGWTHVGYTVHLREGGEVVNVGTDVDDEDLLETASALSQGFSGHYLSRYLDRLSRHFGGARHG